MRRNQVPALLVFLSVTCCVLLVALIVAIATNSKQSQHRVETTASGAKPSLVATALAALTVRPVVIEMCSFGCGVNDSGNYDYEFTANVTNNTRSAIDQLTFYIRAREPQRTVPIGECLDSIDVAGGIEPGETRQVNFYASLSDFGNYKYPQPPKAPFEVAIVDEYPLSTVKLYKHFSGVKMFPVTGDYTPRADSTLGSPKTPEWFNDPPSRPPSQATNEPSIIFNLP